MRGFEWYKLHQNLITRSRVICDSVCYTNHVIGIAELRITMRNSIQKSAILRIWRNNCSVILTNWLEASELLATLLIRFIRFVCRTILLRRTWIVALIV